MFDYSTVAVEIWHLILLEAIDVPYLLDTMIDPTADYWTRSPLYHDYDRYTKSEQTRRTLGLVCQSWRIFIDGYKYRWITYNTGLDKDPRKQREVLEALNSLTLVSADQPEGSRASSRPRRIMFHINCKEDVDIFRQLVESCSSKVTILFTECAETFEDATFEHLINHSSKIPNLRFLTICGPNYALMPLRAISEAFPRLFTLAISHNRFVTYPLRERDVLILPELEVLGMDLSQTDPETLTSWDLRGLRQLHTRLSSDYKNGVYISMEPIRLFGANLSVLNIHKLQFGRIPIPIPFEFWTWCPLLRELMIFLSGIYLDTAAPDGHPLKFLVHWPYYDNIELDPEWAVSSSHLETWVILHNLTLLPIGLDMLLIWKSWAGYMSFLSARYNKSEREAFLARMNEICLQRSIRVEDRLQVSLGDFLAGRDERAALTSSPSNDSS